MTVGEYIEWFANDRYGSVSAFGREIGMTPQQLDKYISGKSAPAFRQLQRFHNAGMDIIPLMNVDEETGQLISVSVDFEPMNMRIDPETMVRESGDPERTAEQIETLLQRLKQEIREVRHGTV